MAVIRCPACNKTGLTTPACPRCGCDLTSLHRIQQAATWYLADAAALLRDQEWFDAYQHAAKSWRLRHSLEAARLAFLAACITNDATLVALWHERAQPSGTGD